MGSRPLGFLANPQLSTDLVCLDQPPFESRKPCYSPHHYELLKIYFELKSQYFPLALFTEGFGSCHMERTFLYSIGDL